MDHVLVYFIQVSSLKWNKVGEKRSLHFSFHLLELGRMLYVTQSISLADSLTWDSEP